MIVKIPVGSTLMNVLNIQYLMRLIRVSYSVNEELLDS